MTANARRGLFVIVLAAALLTAACVVPTQTVGTRVDVIAEDRSIVEPGDAIAILPQEVVGCISKALRQIQPSLRIVPPDEFRRMAFPDNPPDRIPFTTTTMKTPTTPWWQYRGEPSSPRTRTTITYIPEDLGQRLSTQEFRDRVAPLNLRYLVSISEIVQYSVPDAVGFPSLFVSWKEGKTLTLSASVIELKDARVVGRIEASAMGIRRFGYPPHLFVETTHGPACKALGEALANFLSGRFPGRDVR